MNSLNCVDVCLRLVKIKEWVDANDPGALIIPFSAGFELDFFDVPEEDKEQYQKDKGAVR